MDPADSPFSRDALPEEVAPSYLFLASDAAVLMTGQVIHPNGGLIVES